MAVWLCLAHVGTKAIALCKAISKPGAKKQTCSQREDSLSDSGCVTYNEGGVVLVIFFFITVNTEREFLFLTSNLKRELYSELYRHYVREPNKKNGTLMS